ncbi:MAG: hypothetical protein IPK74_20935 [Deltaproteobacteria bacterium]|nr:hypothetical protein [Deltaproteobacteria bacterium]
MTPVPWLMLALAQDPAAPRDEPPPAGEVVLEWSAPSACPTRRDVQRRLGELLGAASSNTAGVRVSGTVVAEGSGFALTLRTHTASGTSEHTLASPDCRALADGAALIAAVAADPLAVDRTLQAPPPEAPPPPDETVVTVSPPLDDPPRRRGRLRLARFALRAEGALESGLLPKLGFGPIVSAGMIGPYWRAELSAIYLAPRSVFTDASKTAGAAIGRWAVRARGCGVPTWRILEFPLCMGFEGGQLSARPLGTGMTAAAADGRDARGFGVWSAGGAIGISPRPFVAFFVGVDGLVALARPRFVSGGVLLHEPHRGGVRASVGLELRVP